MNIELTTAYIGIDSRDPAACARYLREVVGLMPGEAPAGAHSTWRLDGKAMRLWLQAGARDDAACLGFEAQGAAAYDRVLSRLAAAGVAVQPLSSADCALRGVHEGVRMDTPWGVPVELVQGLADSAVPFASAHYAQGFVTGDQGFGHAVFVVNSAAAYEASRRFAIDALGLKLSDWLRLPLGPVTPEGGPEMNVSFFHCNARHHSLAIACVPVPEVPQKLHHLNFEVATLGPVGAAYERALASGTPLANALGQHDNDRMVSFYSTSPAGWRVEIGATGRTITDDWADVREYDRISVWGHQPPEMLVQMLQAGLPKA